MSTPGDLLEALGREARARLAGGRAPGVKVFRGRNVDELIPQIERELGADALIVRRREGLRGGLLGFFQHAFVEIEAMPGRPRLDTYDEERAFTPEPGFEPDPLGGAQPRGVERPAGGALAPAPGSPPAFPPAPAPGPVPSPAPMPPGLAQRYAPPTAMPPPSPPTPAPPTQAPSYAPSAYVPPSPAAYSLPPASDPTSYPYARAVQAHEPPAAADGPSAYVTARLAALARYEPRVPSPPSPVRQERPSVPVDYQELLGPELPRRPEPPLERQSAAPREHRTVPPGSQSRARAGVEKGLCRYGLSEEFARELIDVASAHTLPLSPRAGLASAVRSTLAQRIPVAPALPAQGGAVVLVGPGGSGKTTCCATLLGAYRASSTLPASYATVMRRAETGELRMVLSPHIVKPTLAGSARALRALRRVRVDGLGIVDTPSLSPSDRTAIRELARLLGEIKPERVVVALPATLGAAAAEQLLEAFAPLGAHSLVVTHADETDQIGVAVEAACRHGLAPEYLLEHGRAGQWRLQRLDPTELAARILQ